MFLFVVIKFNVTISWDEIVAFLVRVFEFLLLSELLTYYQLLLPSDVKVSWIIKLLPTVVLLLEFHFCTFFRRYSRNRLFLSIKNPQYSLSELHRNQKISRKKVKKFKMISYKIIINYLIFKFFFLFLFPL